MACGHGGRERTVRPRPTVKHQMKPANDPCAPCAAVAMMMPATMHAVEIRMPALRPYKSQTKPIDTCKAGRQSLYTPRGEADRTWPRMVPTVRAFETCVEYADVYALPYSCAKTTAT